MSQPHPNLTMAIRGLVTLVLVAFAFVTDDPATTSLIVGAVLGYWLREGEGRALRRRRRGGRRGATDADETDTTSGTGPTDTDPGGPS